VPRRPIKRIDYDAALQKLERVVQGAKAGSPEANAQNMNLKAM